MKLFRMLMPFLVGYTVLEEYGFEVSNEFQRHFYQFTSLLGYVVLVSGTLLAGGFLAFDAESFEEIYEHFYEFATGLNYTFYFISIHWMCKEFFELNDNYDEIIKRRSKIAEKREIYEKASEFIEKWSKYMYIGYVKFVFPCTTIPYLLMSYFNYFTTDLGSDAFLLPFVMWKIFNRRTPIAYLFAFTLQFLAAAYTILVGTTLMLHVFGSIWLFMAFVYDVRTEMDGLDAYRQTEISDAKFYKHLCEFIQFHSDIKQLLSRVGCTYAMIFMLNLLWTASTMAVLLFSLQMELIRPEIDPPTILKDISFIYATIVIFVVICSVCEELKAQYEDLNIYLHSNWYHYPMDVRRILIIILIDSQNLNPFKIVGSITASRETSKRVINGGFVTMMALRTIIQ